MTVFGILECNRCRMKKIQDIAAKEKLTVTLRKSLYGLTPQRKGVDVYMHPDKIDIPSSYVVAHNGELQGFGSDSLIWDDKDPEKWLLAWFPDIPIPHGNHKIH